ncbi:hypothetical protein Q5752_003807 [Cryptotrichosporon argae]
MNPFAPPESGPIPGSEYIRTLHAYLKSSLPRLAPTPPRAASPSSFLSQSYTLLTLGLDPSSAPLSPALKVPLTLGFGTPSPSPSTLVSRSTPAPRRPQLLRLAPDKLLYLLLRWQSLPQGLAHVGGTDEPIDPGVSVAARPGGVGKQASVGGDAQSIRSWVPSMRSVSTSVRSGWWGREEVSEEKLLLELYAMFTVIPGVLIHPPYIDDRPIAELVDAGGYTQLGGIDVRVPLDVFRNLQILELDYDPRALRVPTCNLRELHVRSVPDGDDWILPLLCAGSGTPRFPHLVHLSLTDVALLSLPSLPLPNLRSLDLSANLLDAVPPSLAELDTLKSLNLSGNVVASVRGAPRALGNVAALNLSRNRLDVLVGLERVLGLTRLDLRYNRIRDVGELGRLADHPVLAELWADGNDTPDYRVELGAAFAQARHGRIDVVLDGRPFGWQETRQIEALLDARGVRRTPTTTPAATLAAPASGQSTAPSSLSRADNPHIDRLATPGSHPHASQSIASPAPDRKRRKRRVVNLDGTVGALSDEGGDALDANFGAAARQAGGSLQVPRRTRRERVSASMFEQ